MKNFKFKINGTEYSVDINEVEGQEIKLDVNGTPYKVTVDKELKQKQVVMTMPLSVVLIVRVSLLSPVFNH